MHSDLERALARADEIVFLCSGNMLRSPFAELWARHRGIALPVRSAATTYRNRGIHAEAARALLERGVPAAACATFRPTHASELAPAPDERSLVLGMTRDHLAAAGAHWPEARARFLLASIRGALDEIADPLLDGRWSRAFGRIADAVDALVLELRRVNPGA